MVVSAFSRRFWLTTIAVVAAGVAVAQPSQEVTIGVSSSSMGAAGFRMANELGLFKAQNLTPRFVVMDTGSAVTTALISGSVQFALAGGGELVAAQARGQKVVATTNSYGRTSATLVLSKAVADRLNVPADATVEQRLKALDGLLIATTSATGSTNISFQAAAKRAGANFRSVYMAQEAMPAALDSGAVQGFASAAPYWSAPITKGTGVLWISGPKGELPNDLSSATANHLQVMRGYAEAHPDIVGKMERIYRAFIMDIDERPSDVKAVIAKLYPGLDKATINLLFETESLGWKAKPLTPADIDKEITFIKMSGTRIPGLDQLEPSSLLFKPE